MILVVYLGHGSLHFGRRFIFLQISFLGEASSSEIEEPQKKRGAPLSQQASEVCEGPRERNGAHLCPSTRRT